jgi:hypothetical protein
MVILKVRYTKFVVNPTDRNSRASFMIYGMIDTQFSRDINGCLWLVNIISP